MIIWILNSAFLNPIINTNQNNNNKIIIKFQINNLSIWFIYWNFTKFKF